MGKAYDRSVVGQMRPYEKFRQTIWDDCSAVIWFRLLRAVGMVSVLEVYGVNNMKTRALEAYTCRARANFGSVERIECAAPGIRVTLCE